jgi:tetratricopeptide (TPR) repeat protein
MSTRNISTSGSIGVALLALFPAVTGADTLRSESTSRDALVPLREPTWVVLRSVDVNLRIGRKMIDTKRRLHRYHVVYRKGDWVWLVGEIGPSGWAKRCDVVPIEEAVAYFGAAVKRDPQSAQAYRMRGLAHFAAGLYGKAEADANEAIRLDPKFAPAYADRSTARSWTGDFDAALADANTAIDLGPGSPAGYESRARVWSSQGNYARSVTDLSEAIRRDPSDGLLRASRASDWSQCRDLQKAATEYTEALRLEPTLCWVYSNRGAARSELGDDRGAMADFNEAIRIDPTSFVPYVNRGSAWLRRNEYHRALADVNHAIELAPNFNPLYLLRAQIWKRLEDWHRAFADCDRVRNADPTLVPLNSWVRLQIWNAYNGLESSDEVAALVDAPEVVNVKAQNTVAIQFTDDPFVIPTAIVPSRPDPADLTRRFVHVLTLRHQKNDVAALQAVDELIELDPEMTGAYQQRSLLRSTCTDAAFRNGQRAVQDALKARELNGKDTSGLLHALGMAYAEAGDFDLAVTWETKASALDPPTDENRSASRELIEGYKNHRPFRSK